MPTQLVKTTLIVRTLENDMRLAEALLSPEISSYGRNASRLRSEVGRHLREMIEKMPAMEIHRRRGVTDARVVKIEVALDAPARHREVRSAEAVGPPVEAWTEPVTLKFHTIQWEHGSHASLAFIPALGIEVIAPTAEELARRIPG